jgi:hypothetical protein
MDGEKKEPVFNPRTGRTVHSWIRFSKHWPNHLLDCETMQIALASFFGLLNIEGQE